MTDLTPALTAEEWTTLAVQRSRWAELLDWKKQGRVVRVVASDDDYAEIYNDAAPAVIALLNHALPADHPGKLTWDMVDIIREAGKRIGREGNPYLGFAENLEHYADVLATLLPPRREG